MIVKIEKHFKRKKAKIRNKRNTFPSNKWFDDECKISKSLVNRFFKSNSKYLHIASVRSKYTELKKSYNSVRQRKKRQFLKSTCEELEILFNKKNKCEFWKFWSRLKSNNTPVVDDIDLGTFEVYYQQHSIPPADNIFDLEHMSEVEKYVNTYGKNYNPDFTSELVRDIYDVPITADEIITQCKKLKKNKSAGIDCIPYEFYIYVIDHLMDILICLFNKILESGNYPAVWVKGISPLLYKAGDHSDPDNYRRLTLTSAIGKIF